MWKRLRITLVLLVCLLLSGCCLKHEWHDATCSAPKTCVKCGETEGEMLPHTWKSATCTAPKTCIVCGTTEGEPLGHQETDWIIKNIDWLDCVGMRYKECKICKEVIKADRFVPQRAYTDGLFYMTPDEFEDVFTHAKAVFEQSIGCTSPVVLERLPNAGYDDNSEYAFALVDDSGNLVGLLGLVRDPYTMARAGQTENFNQMYMMILDATKNDPSLLLFTTFVYTCDPSTSMGPDVATAYLSLISTGEAEVNGISYYLELSKDDDILYCGASISE